MLEDVINSLYLRKPLILFSLCALLSISYCGNGSSFKNTDKNNSPTAYDISTTTLVNSSVDIILQATDPENQQLTYRIIDNPGNGSLTQKAYNIYRYVPDADYEGDDDFSFRVNDGAADSNTGKVSINIGIPNHPPAAQDLDVHTTFNTMCEIVLTATDADNDAIEIHIIQQPEHGNLEIIDGRYYYHPAENYYGTDSILYQATDAYSTGSVGRISIEVGVINNAPDAIEITETIAEDAVFILPFSVTIESHEIWDSPITYEISVQPGHGTVTYNSLTGEWIYTPETNYNGVITFYYRAFDGIDYSSDTPVTLNISPLNDAPAVADFTLIVTESSTPHNIPIQGSDPDGDNLTFTINQVSSLPGSFSYSNGDENAVYTSPAVAGNYGLYELTYTAKDTENNVSNTGRIYIVIRPENVWFVNPGNTGIQTGKCWHQGFRYISDAVSAAQPGDRIWINGGTGVTHTVKPGEFTIADFTGKTDMINSKGLTLIGGFALNSYNITDSSPALRPSVIDGEKMAEHLIIKAENLCIIRNIRITGGNATGTEAFKRGGGIYVPENKKDIYISNIIIENSHAVSGGGIYIGQNCSSLTIENSAFNSNTSEIRGAGMAIAENTKVTLTDCQFTGNITDDFGGGLSNMGTATLNNCIFTGNNAQYGGGVYDHNNPSIYTNCDFISNTAVKSGGGIFNYGSLSLVDCGDIRNNNAPRGGGIFNDASGIGGTADVHISNCDISYNTASQNGGGIYNLHSTVLIDNGSNINNNQNTGTEEDNGGGGIFCGEGTNLTVNSSAITNNTANMNGGGIFSIEYSNLIFNNAVMGSNRSNSRNGGGLSLSQSIATLTNSTISGNDAVYGGGIYIDNYSRLFFSGTGGVYPYIKLNTAYNSGGGIYSLNSLFSITNSHIENNSFTLAAGSGGGIYADTSNVALNSVYVEKNHGAANASPLNYSGYHLKNCQTAALSLCRSDVINPGESDYDTQHGNYLTGTDEPYLFQFYNGL